MSYGLLYGLWGLLFGISACVGFFPPPEDGLSRAMSMVLAVAVFVPAWLILMKSPGEKGRKHRRILRNLCLASIGGTTVLMALNVMSAGWPEQVGNALYAALVVVSAPMVCGRNFMLSLFLWGVLLMASLTKSDKK